MPVRRIDIGKQIAEAVRALLDSRRRHGKGRFTDADKDWGADGRTGPMASMQGLRTTFSATSIADDEPSLGIWSIIEPEIESLTEEWRLCMAELKEEFYPSPYDEASGSGSGGEGPLRQLFSERGERPAYVDSISWALSTGVLAHYALSLWKRHQRSGQRAGLLEATREQVWLAIQALLAAQCEDGGWTWRGGMPQGHLFFTWSAMEGWADFYDYVVGESEKEIGIGQDEELITYLRRRDDQLFEKIARCRERATDFLAQRYLKEAIETGLTARALSDASAQIVVTPKNDLVLTYFDLFLLEALILGGYDIPGGVVDTTRRDELELLQLAIAGKLPKLREPSFADDPQLSTLRFEIRKQSMGRRDVPWTVQDAGLWPQLLRTLVLYRFYTAQDSSEDPAIVGDRGSALKLLQESRRTPEEEWAGLWDSEAFNLAITARSIEGLIDCYDYFGLLDHLRRKDGPSAGAGVPADSVDIFAALATALLPHLASRLQPSTASPVAQGEAARGGETLVRHQDFPAKLVSALDDVIEPLELEGGMTSALLLRELLGGAQVDDMKRDPKQRESVALLEKLVHLTVFVGYRLFDVIVREAILHAAPAQGTDPEVVGGLRAREAKGGAFTLRNRISFAVSALLMNEGANRDRPDDDLPSYRQAIEQVLTRRAAVPPRKG